MHARIRTPLLFAGWLAAALCLVTESFATTQEITLIQGAGEKGGGVNCELLTPESPQTFFQIAFSGGLTANEVRLGDALDPEDWSIETNESGPYGTFIFQAAWIAYPALPDHGEGQLVAVDRCGWNIVDASYQGLPLTTFAGDGWDVATGEFDSIEGSGDCPAKPSGPGTPLERVRWGAVKALWR